jgi:hypothetical protein
MLTEPPIKLLETQSACFVKIQQKRECIRVIKFQAVAVDAQERGHYGYRDALISINESVVLRQTFPQSRRFLN